MARVDARQRIERRMRRARLDVSREAVDRLTGYFELLTSWNQKMNLTADVESDDALDRLITEPVMAARFVEPSNASVIDIGSGGGSPAIPLKSVLPDVSLWMVEAKTRKSAFLREAARQLGLDRVTVETSRFETLLTRPELHESFDVVTIRAVKIDAGALLKLQAFLKPKGQILLFSSGALGRVEGPTQPLVLEGVEPLVQTLGSQLVRFRKLPLSLGR